MQKERIQITLSEDTLKKLYQLQEAMGGISKSATVTIALTEYLEHLKELNKIK